MSSCRSAGSRGIVGVAIVVAFAGCPGADEVTGGLFAPDTRDAGAAVDTGPDIVAEPLDEPLPSLDVPGPGVGTELGFEEADLPRVDRVNLPPTVVILAPEGAVPARIGASVDLRGSVLDDVDPAQVLQTTWTLGSDGVQFVDVDPATDATSLLHAFTQTGIKRVTLRSVDSEGAIGEAFVEFPIVAAPLPPSVALLPLQPTTLDALQCVASSGESGVTLEYTWLRNGLPTDLVGAEVPAALTERGDVWKVLVIAVDALGPGPARGAEVAIGDAAPLAPEVHVEPMEPDLLGSVTCVIDAEGLDPDGDPVATSVSWSLNGEPVADLDLATVSLSELDLGASGVSVGAEIRCHGVTSDGIRSGPMASSSAAVVQAADVCASATFNDCDVHAVCSNTGTLEVVCACSPGWEGDGQTCTDVDECAVNNGGCGETSRWKCVNPSAGSPVGCVDVDECAVDNGACGPPAFWTCANQVGAAPTCTDVNECAVANGGCGSATHWKCANAVGGPPTCADIDECAAANGGCGSATYWKCTNVAGGSATCVDIDECAVSNGGCGSATYWKCTNQTGKKATCADIDECKVQNGACGSATFWKCANQVGKKPTCTDINECSTSNGGCGPVASNTCTNQTGKAAKCTEIATYHMPWTCGVKKTCTAGNGQFHHSGNSYYAFDFSVSTGTTLRAMRKGKVTAVHNSTTPGKACYNGCSGGSGFEACCNACITKANWVNIQHSDGTIAHYGHLSSISVKVGNQVAKGGIIGKAGTTGCSTGPHLHTGVMKGCPTGICKMIKFSFVEFASPKSGKSITSKNCP